MRAARTARKLRQQDVAQQLNLRVASLSEYENGHKLGSAEVLLRISKVLRVDVAWLLEGDVEISASPHVRAPHASLLRFLSTDLGRSVTSAELAALRTFVCFHGSPTSDTYHVMLVAMRGTIVADPLLERRNAAHISELGLPGPD